MSARCGYQEPLELVAKARADALIRGASALALQLENGRYFVKFSTCGKVITSWSIAGALQFIADDTYSIGVAEKRLAASGRGWSRVVIGIVEVIPQ